MQKEKVSIIVTCFNQEHCIERSLQSISDQSYSHWECIIIDDGSKDSSADTIKAYIDGDLRFKYVFQKNSGVAAARNKGFSLASGDYINFLDGDDTFKPKKLEKQIDCFINDAKLDICICDHDHYIHNSNTVEYFKFTELKPDPIKQIIYDWQDGVAFPQHAVLYKRAVWDMQEKPYPTDYKGRSEDWIFNITVALKGKQYFFLNKILCTYHHYGNNYTTEIFNSASSAIHAAFYINKKLPEEYQTDFIDHTIQKSMNRYLEDKKIKILQSSGNWRLGNIITRPFFTIKDKVKKWI